MSSELAKHLERAEKAIARGKPDLALEAYLDALREDPKNDKVCEAAADLCVTLNRPAHAATLLSPLFDRLASIIGVNAIPEPDPEFMRPADIPVLIGDSTKVRAATGWTPHIVLDQTLRDLVDAQAD